MNREMPFGKYKGRPITEVPWGYLRWLRDNVTLNGWLEEAVSAVLSGRPVPAYDPDSSVKKMKAILQEGEWSFKRDEAPRK